MSSSDKKAAGLTLVSGTLGYFLNGTLWAGITLALGIILILYGHFQESKEKEEPKPILDFSGKPFRIGRTPKPWMLTSVLVGMVVMVLAGGLWKWRQHSAIIRESTELNPIDSLRGLGWTVQPDKQIAGMRFQASSEPLPSLQQSAEYFRSLNRPFGLVITGAETLEGLELLDGMPNLRSLELNAGKFRDISKLSHLTSLTRLALSQDANISDISPLSALTNLHELGLSGGVRDLTPIENLKGLTGLGLETPGLYDLAPVRGLSSLKSLGIVNTNIVDLSPLAGIIALKELVISPRQLPGLWKLSHNNNITTLKLVDTGIQIIADLSPICQLPKLEVLDLTVSGSAEIDLSPLRHLKRLTWLRIMCFNFGYLAGVRGIDAIGELSELRTLILANLRFTDLSFVGNLKKLNDLSVDRITINNITAIGMIKSLKTVDLSRTPVVDISPLLNLPDLTTLVIVGTPARSDVVTELERRGVKIVR